ncbi:hypothetical protein RZN22_10430, partial [Bacillaceae bacterium S4-13-58]
SRSFSLISLGFPRDSFLPSGVPVPPVVPVPSGFEFHNRSHKLAPTCSHGLIKFHSFGHTE